MAENKSGSGLPVNLTTIMALLTCLGGLWVVSKNPSSDRPNSPAETRFPSIGVQQVEARLWEDPLDWETNHCSSNILAQLQQAISENSGSNLTLLPVITSGGSYSEDREVRLRNRYATISALGESGYAPEDADHVGAVDIPWPSESALQIWLTDTGSHLSLEATNLRCSRGSAHRF